MNMIQEVLNQTIPYTLRHVPPNEIKVYQQYIQHTPHLHLAEYDCSEIVDDLMGIIQGGTEYIITVNGKLLQPFKVMENGKIVEYVNHHIFVKGQYVFDPRLFHYPLPTTTYQAVLTKMNTGVSFFIREV